MPEVLSSKLQPFDFSMGSFNRFPFPESFFNLKTFNAFSLSVISIWNVSYTFTLSHSQIIFLKRRKVLLTLLFYYQSVCFIAEHARVIKNTLSHSKGNKKKFLRNMWMYLRRRNNRFGSFANNECLRRRGGNRKKV